MNNYHVLLGGIGADSHSVGLTILRQGLLRSGYQVSFLGTQNLLEDFGPLASSADAIFISSLDGHAKHYLSAFHEFRSRFVESSALWYLGGNLSTDSGLGIERHFISRGFDRVFVKFTDINSVLKVLAEDLQDRAPRAASQHHTERFLFPRGVYHEGESSASDDLFSSRDSVLEQWKTGYLARDIESNAKFLTSCQNFVLRQRAAHHENATIVQPRSGVPLVAEQIRYFLEFKRFGVECLSYQVDSLTRNGNFSEVDELLTRGGIEDISGLNGFPVVNHGPLELRKIVRNVNLPIQVRHSAKDPRLLAEISFAGGATSFEGGSICYNLPYYKNLPLEVSIRRWKYVDQLAGLYTSKYGVPIDREFFGTLTGTLIPPSLAICVCLIEMMLAIPEGVKSFSLGYAEQGNRIQDVAALRVMRKLSAEILRNLGCNDVQIETVFYQYMAAFPSDEKKAAELIVESGLSGGLSGARRIINKTSVEAFKIPSLQDNLDGIAMARLGLSMADRTQIDEAKVNLEEAIIEAECNAIIETVLFEGGGNLADGVIRGIAAGVIDIPFSPSVYNRGIVQTVRDCHGAVRFLSFGNLPFPRWVKEFHEDLVSERRRSEGFMNSNEDYRLIEADVLRVARNDFTAWPLSN